MAGARRTNLVLYGSTVVVLLLAVAALAYLLADFRRSLEANVAGLQRFFADEALLKLPEDPRIRFRDIEELAQKYENFGSFGRITVTKFFGDTERVIYPFYAGPLLQSGGPVPPILAERPYPGNAALAFRELNLMAGDRLLGRLLVELRTGPLRTVSTVILGLVALLAGAVALFLAQFQRQQRELSKTMVALHEKRGELIRMERLALAGQLSANLLHDLRKPVLNIRSEVAEDTPSGDAELRPRVKQQVDHFFGMLRESNFERFVRAESGSEFVDLKTTLEESLALVQYERGNVEVSLSAAPGLPPLLAPRLRLMQVFSNLILNSYQAMDGTGELCIAIAPGADRTAVVTLTDTGPGIPAELRERLFTPFFTTRADQGGTGLGLYIAQDIVTELGGRVRILPSAAGAAIAVTLPLPKE